MSKPKSILPYLIFNGRCEEAIEFYRKAIGAEVEMLMRFKDAPDQSMISPGHEEKIMHATLKIGATRFFASDGRCEPNVQLQRIFTVARSGGRSRRENVFQRAGGRRANPDAADENIFLAVLRHGR